MTIFGVRHKRYELPLAVMAVALVACIEWECSPLGILIVAASWLGSAVIAAAVETVYPKVQQWRHDTALIRSINTHPSGYEKATRSELRAIRARSSHTAA